MPGYWRGTRVYICRRNNFYVDYRQTKITVITSISLSWVATDTLKKHLLKKVGIVCLFLCENKLHSKSSFSLKSLDYQQCQVCFNSVEEWLVG